MVPCRLPAVLAVLIVAAPGCGEKDPKVLRPRFRAAIEAHYEELRRVAIKERDLDEAPLVHDFIDIKYPDVTEEQMPVPKRKVLWPAKDDPDAEKPVEGALEAEVSYYLVTFKRQEEKLVVPDNPVDPVVKPDKVEVHETDVQPIYVPAVYRRGKEHFVYYGGRLIPDPFPREETLTEQERLAIIKPPKNP